MNEGRILLALCGLIIQGKGQNLKPRMNVMANFNCPENDRDFGGPDIQVVAGVGPGWQRCGDQCKITEGCNFWTYFPNKDCHLKNERKNYISKPGAYSGGKSCPFANIPNEPLDPVQPGKPGGPIDPGLPLCETIIKARKATTGKKLAGVKVIYALPGKDPVTKKTRRDGTVNLGRLKTGITLEIKLEKNLYDTITDNIVIGGSCGVPISMSLNPFSKHGRIVLSWQKDKPSDLDLHVKSDNDCHIYYKYQECKGNNLDVDNTEGGSNGPETITIKKSRGRRFVVFVRNYGNYGDPDGNMCKAGAKVSIYPGGEMATNTVVDVPSKCRRRKHYWLIGCFGGAGSLRSFDIRNKMMKREPSVDICTGNDDRDNDSDGGSGSSGSDSDSETTESPESSGSEETDSSGSEE